MSNLRLLQVFLTPKTSPIPSYSEVFIDEHDVLSCNCPGYRGKGKCKHVKLVQERLDENDFNYPLIVVGKVTDEDLEKANSSSEAMTQFIRTYGKIEVY